MKKVLSLALVLLTASCTGIKDEKVTPENLKGLFDKAMKGDELTKGEKEALEAGVNKLIVPTMQIDSSSGYSIIQVDNDMRRKSLRGKTINDLIIIGHNEMSRRVKNLTN